MFRRSVALLIPLLLSLATAGDPDNNPAPTDELKIGDAAPTFALPNLVKGEMVFLRDYCGETLRKPSINKIKYVVILSYFASWCKPCIKEIPILHEVVAGYKDKHLKTFLINEQDDKKEVRKIVEKEKYTLPVLLDMYGRAAKNYKLVSENDTIGLPRLFVINKDGTIQMINKGFKGSEEEFKNQLTGLLDKLLAE